MVAIVVIMFKPRLPLCMHHLQSRLIHQVHKFVRNHYTFFSKLFIDIGNVYIADSSNYRIRKITVATSDISTVGGTGTGSYGGDGSAATSASFANPTAVTLDSSSKLIYYTFFLVFKVMSL